MRVLLLQLPLHVLVAAVVYPRLFLIFSLHCRVLLQKRQFPCVCNVVYDAAMWTLVRCWEVVRSAG